MPAAATWVPRAVAIGIGAGSDPSMNPLGALLDMELPVIQAPMAGTQDEALAIAVAQAGGLGSMPCAMLDAAGLERALVRFAALPRPVNLNFFCHAMAAPDPVAVQRWQRALQPYYREFGIEPPAPGVTGVRRPIDAATVGLLEAFRPKVLSFHFGLPEPSLLARMKGWGAVVLATATTVEEGRWLERRGADVVIAQGIEPGGHRGQFLAEDLAGQTGTRELVAALAGALSVPVVAAGGISSRGDVLAMLDAGASAIQAGTAYLLCPEATTSAAHRAALQQAGRDTAITNLFSGRPARGLVNRLMRERGPLSGLAPAFPWASQSLAPLRAAAEARGLDDFSPLWSGTSPGAFPGLDAPGVTRRLAGMDRTGA